MKKRIISGILTMLIIITLLQTSVLAGDKDDSDANTNSILIEYGYTDGTLQALPNDDKNKIADMLRSSSDKVAISTHVMEVDTLTEIEMFLSFTNDELLSMGMSQNEIDFNQAGIQKVIEMTDENLKNECGKDDLDIKLFRKAVENGKNINENQKEKDTKIFKNKVVASGSLSSSFLTISQGTVDNSTSDAPEYRVVASYSWDRVPFWNFNDSVCIAWGGGFNTDAVSGSVSYYYAVDGGYTGDQYIFGGYADSREMDIEQIPQSGVKYSFEESFHTDNLNPSQNKNGYAALTLYQTQYQGYDTLVTSQYAHREWGWDGGISLSESGISFNFGGDFTTSDQQYSTLHY